jgi:hypothetical protein
VDVLDVIELIMLLELLRIGEDVEDKSVDRKSEVELLGLEEVDVMPDDDNIKAAGAT